MAFQVTNRQIGPPSSNTEAVQLNIMKRTVFSVLLILLLLGTSTVFAQKREDLRVQSPTVQLYDQAPAFSLDKLFSPEHFRLSHSYELSYGNIGGSGLTTGMYTAGLNWHFNNKLAARLDVGMLHTPFGTGDFATALGGKDSYSSIFVRNAEIAYRPTENSMIHLSFRQLPMGAYGYGAYGYGSPYGYMDRYGYYRNEWDPGYGYDSMRSSRASYRSGSGELFWNPNYR